MPFNLLKVFWIPIILSLFFSINGLPYTSSFSSHLNSNSLSLIPLFCILHFFKSIFPFFVVIRETDFFLKSSIVDLSFISISKNESFSILSSVFISIMVIL